MWMGWKAPYEQDMILVTGDNGSLDEIVIALRQIGLDRVLGYLDGGMAAWDGEKVTLDSMPVEELDRQRQAGLTILDVRAEAEHREGHIPGATNVFAGDLAQGMKAPDTLGTAERIAVICGSGYRSTVAASLLQAQGFTNLVNVDSGMEAWNEAGLPVTKGTDT
jgi:hydroxyacylglutathione hydrolase